MAIVDHQQNSALVLKYEDGLTPTGGPNIRQKTLNYVRPDASHADLYQVAAALFSLSELPLIAVLVRDMTELIEEEPEG